MKIEKWNDVHGNTTPDERMVAFLESSTDAYAVLQLKRIDETRDERFESLSALQRRGKEPDIEHYDVVYTGTLPPYTDQSAMLEGLYTKFNIDHPEDFRGHSMSMSDIVAATKTTAPPATERTLSGESSPKKSVAANSKMTIGST